VFKYTPVGAPGGSVLEHFEGTKEQALEKMLVIFREITEAQNRDLYK
jgi:hypothetical protein